MEENSEAQMETDASTTTDVSGTQETTDLHADMETVIVIEKLMEEDSTTADPDGKHETLEEIEKTPVKENNASPEKLLQVPIIIKLPPKTSELSSLVPQQKEFQISPQKDMVVVKTYSRSPVKNSQKSPITSEQSKNLELLQKPADSSSKEMPQGDLKSLHNDQFTGMQILPAEPEQSKNVEPLQDIMDTQNKIGKSPIKDQPKVLQRLPPKDIPLVQESTDTLSLAPRETQETPEKEKVPSQMEDSINSQILPAKPCIENESNQPMTEDPSHVRSLTEKEDTQKINNAMEGQKQVEGIPPVVPKSPVEVLSEKSSDSTLGTASDVTEPHNKSISRELKSLIKSAKESKIISECTQLTTKTRKSRGVLDTSSSSTTGADTDRQIGSRRNSDNSLMSTCSEKSDKANLKRSMRSQNPEFVNKVKLFLNSVTGKVSKMDSEVISDEETEEKKSRDSLNESLLKSPKKKKLVNENEPIAPTKGNKIRSDPYCWRCHWAVEQEVNEKQHLPMLCTVCPRSFHYKCLSGTERSKIISEKNWVCPECLIVLQAESSETRSPAMKKISLGTLSDLLKYALERMMDLNGVEPFILPVDRTVFPDYEKYVVHPMTLAQMKENIKNGLYGSTEAFLADAQWILHNSIIFNTSDGVISVQSKLTAAARALVRSCKMEIGEIEACAECYAAAHSRRPTWFTDVCATPHMLLWAKLKGFPYWPAKCMSVSSANLVDVRFFGAHDRAWVPARDCFLFSEKDPNNFRTKRQDILDSMQEAEQHIRNISRKYGKFVYPPFKTQLDPTKLTEQLKMMIPSFEGEVKTPIKDKSTPKIAKSKSRSNSKGSKTSSNDGDGSDGEDVKSRPRKMADGAEIAMEEDFTVDKDKIVISTENVQQPKQKEASKKRRRSELEEAVITIMEGPKEKRKCVENDVLSQDKQPNNQVNIHIAAEDTLRKKSDISKSDVRKIVSTLTPVSSLTPVEEKYIINISSPTQGSRPPIKMILKTNKPFKITSPKDKDSPEKVTPVKPKGLRIEKLSLADKEKYEEKKSQKRRNSKNKSLNSSVSQIPADKNDANKASNAVNESLEIGKDKVVDDLIILDDKTGDISHKTPNENANPKENNNGKTKTDKLKNNSIIKAKEVDLPTENITAKTKESAKSKESDTAKPKDGEKSKETANGKINKDSQKSKFYSKSKESETNQLIINKHISAKRNSTTSPKTTKEVMQFDEDNTSLAIIARENSKRGSSTGLPTISSVRSLSSPQANEGGTKTNTAKVVETTNGSSIFTPTSTDIVRNMKEAVTKLNKLRSDSDQSLVGKVGVCAFARMPATPPAEKTPNKSKEAVDVEIKAEPMDFDDADRQVEKLHLMNAFRLRPVSAVQAHAASAALREVRINKVTSGPTNARKSTAKPPEPKNRAKKTFPLPRKGEEGRSELNSKNSMVYIPIQPPTTQAPVRVARAVNGNAPTIAVSRANLNVLSSKSPTLGNAAPPTQGALPPAHSVAPTIPPASSTVAVVSVSSGAPACPPLQAFPTVAAGAAGPTAAAGLHSVHTVPLITSVNGQWTFSLQPIMSVGGLDVLDGDSTPPMLNGLAAERAVGGPPALMPAAGLNVAASFPTAPKPLMPSGVSVVPVSGATPNPAVPPLQPMKTSAQGSPLAVINRTATEDSVGEPPRLQHKPLVHPFDASPSKGKTPSDEAGPLTAMLNQNAEKITEFFRAIIENTIERIDDPSAQLTSLKMKLEESRWRHQQEVEEIKHNNELVMAEMRATFEKDKAIEMQELRNVAQAELEAAVKLAKSKQWCANCNQEAQFYCCWNTSYCDFGCQRAHWSQHYAVCAQQRTQDSNTNTDTESNSVNNRLQSPSENLPKTTAAPTLSKGPVARAFGHDQQTASKSSIIVSMVEDTNGNPTVKCVGTYKPAAPAPPPPAPAPAPVHPTAQLVLNKPVNILNNEEIAAAKKVVTSGGYLIVGAAPSATPRRPPTIQYFS